ncbi:cytochrome P450 2A11-like [Perognathus longimembris pacificus]|uniref:cytochrome P450 2A11-like n=1 Tax=Perognathus longimembris pacificus TaxID=214514 RepID=UPI002019B75A|nr:cytochrome P450 2A11-like [Perognathus longimembris pacificus]
MLASGMLLVAVLACLTVLVLMSVWRQWKLSGKLPPGPTPLPFLGNYLQLNTEQMYDSLMKLRDRFGPVFTVHLGPHRVVVLCGQDAVKEALVDQAEEFSGRGEQATFNWFFKGYNVAFSNGERAKQLRCFSITTLRDFGVSKRGIEEHIQQEAGFLIQALQDTRGTFIDPTFYLSRTVSNVISSIVFGDRFDYEDKKFLSLLQMMLSSFQFTATSTGQEKENPNMKFHIKNLLLTTLNLFLAGMETFSTTMCYGFLLLMKHPDVKEIDRVIHKNRQPKFEDRANMPYTEAVIHEIQRFGDMIPRGVASRVTKDTKFWEFLLPKRFNPNHFLDGNGWFKKNDAFVPFSIGKRYCFGEGLARMELFAFLTTIMQNFCFKSTQATQHIDMSPKHVGPALANGTAERQRPQKQQQKSPAENVETRQHADRTKADGGVGPNGRDQTTTAGELGAADVESRDAAAKR